MITKTQPRVIVLQLTDELLTQLQPFLAGLDFTATATQCLTMRSAVYQLLAERVGGALDYEVRWLPNEYEPDGFVERVRPLELMGGIRAPAICPQCGVQILANRAEVACPCGLAVSFISPACQAAGYFCIRPPLRYGDVLYERCLCHVMLR